MFHIKVEYIHLTSIYTWSAVTKKIDLNYSRWKNSFINENIILLYPNLLKTIAGMGFNNELVCS